MTTPFPFVAGQVLTAAQLNSISELPTRTLTATGNAVAADRYSRVILNGSSISYTVNSATFDVGEIVHLYNINSTAATIAAGTGGVTINAAAGLTLAQYQAATLYAVSSTSFVLWKSDVTVASASGLTLVKSQTIGSGVTSVQVTSAFSSTYDNYKITVIGGTSGSLGNMTLQLGSTTTGYYAIRNYVSWAGVNSINNSSNGSSWFIVGGVNTDLLTASLDVLGPNLAKKTVYTGSHWDATTGGGGGFVCGFVNDTTQYTSFTLAANGVSLTGGEIRVYGYQNS